MLELSHKYKPHTTSIANDVGLDLLASVPATAFSKVSLLPSIAFAIMIY